MTVATLHPEKSVGEVSPNHFHYPHTFTLKSGKTLPEFTLIYETYGQLNSDRSNAVMICHALSGDHHVAGTYADAPDKTGWWDNCIGPGKPIDTDQFFVICCNNLGGCSGSTGPASIHPGTGKAYGSDFPIVTVEDWVHSQALLADHLGIERFAAIVGGSLGGMQVLQWAISFPDRLGHAVVIAAAPRLSTQNIAFNNISRRSITTDPNFANGHYYDQLNKPDKGLMLARMLGHITYLSDAALKKKFGRDIQAGRLQFNYETEFEIEKYLEYKGEKFVSRFDANTYLLMTKALDYFDPAAEHEGDLGKTLAGVQAQFFVVSFTSDWRFSPACSLEIVKALIDTHKHVSYLEVEAPHGHDGFLMPVPVYMQGLTNYMQRVYQQEVTA
jgi:homoserine O-acetyltransferase